MSQSIIKFFVLIECKIMYEFETMISISMYIVILKEELSSQREVGFESIKESVTDARAANGVYNAKSDTSQVSCIPTVYLSVHVEQI